MGQGQTAAPTMGAADWAALLVLSGLWSCSFFFYKVLVGAMPPFTVVFGRVLIASLVLGLVLRMRHEALPRDPAQWRAFLIMGLLNNVIPFSLIVYGETRVASGLASILNATTPMFTALVAHLFTASERMTPTKAAGVVIGFLGVAVMVGPDAFSASGSSDLPGQAACILAAVSYGIAGVYGRRFRGLSPLPVATGQLVGSTVLMLPLCLLADRPWMLPMPGPGIWAALLGLAVPSTALAYLLFFRVLGRAGATNVSLVTLLVPIGAVLIGAFALGERLAPQAFAGMVLIGVGLLSIDGRLLRRLRRAAAIPG